MVGRRVALVMEERILLDFLLYLGDLPPRQLRLLMEVVGFGVECLVGE